MKESLRYIQGVKKSLRAWRLEFSQGDDYKITVINSLIRDLELAAVAIVAASDDANEDDTTDFDK